ncbi:MAG: type IX secretion system membrane protein PorP/SprF [Bacteroidetes bacterium]|nr:MAG: type IX secretion system membrane protein PorP/SprF [Bacteroidota bacterium]
MNKLNQIWIFFIVLCASVGANAQDAHFSQIYTNSILVNPAFTGHELQPKIMMAYRNQWPGIDKSFRTFYVAYTQYSNFFNGGIGGYVYRDVAGENDYANLRAAIDYAYRLKINRKNAFQWSMEVTYFQYSINWETMTFADMLDINQGFVNQTNEMIPVGTAKGGIDVSSGAVWMGEKFFGGVAVHHLTKPELLVFGENNYLHRKLSLHGGVNFYLKTPLEKFKITPSVLYLKQQMSQELNIGINIAQEYINLGFWYRKKDALIVVVGLKYNEWHFAYSYDYTLPSFGANNSRGAHEMSLSYKFNAPQKRIKHRQFSCPTF